MREDRTSYIIRKTREAREKQANKARKARKHRLKLQAMARESRMLITEPMSETDVVKKNIRDLQFQLQESYKREKTFTDELYKLRRKVDRLGGDSRQGELDI
jgi:hypothetical protein